MVFLTRRALDCARSEVASDERFPKARPKSIFGYLSLVGIPCGGVVFIFGLGQGCSDAGLFSAIGFCWIVWVVSFVCGVVGIVRCEKPIWPAVIGSILTAIPAIGFFAGMLSRWLH